MAAYKPPLNVHMYLTPVCNLACSHCYYDALPVGSPTPPLLTPSEIGQALTSICDNFDADFHIEGGEVFLREDLETVFSAVPISYWRHVTLTTSGTVKIKVADKYLRALGDLRISLEGHTDELQRLVRGVSLKGALNTCAELSRRGVPYTIRVTLFRQNFTLLHEMIEKFYEVGADRFSFYEFQAVGRGSSVEEELSLSQDDVEGVVSTLTSREFPASVKLFKLSLSGRRVPVVEQERSLLERKGYDIINLGGVASLTINSNGDLGVSPWKITAHAVEDRFANLRDVDLVAELHHQVASGLLTAPCENTSQLLLRWQPRSPFQ